MEIKEEFLVLIFCCAFYYLGYLSGKIDSDVDRVDELIKKFEDSTSEYASEAKIAILVKEKISDEQLSRKNHDQN